MESTSQDTTHDLLLALAGRVDDDLLAWARELVAVGEDGHAVEMLTASLTADRVTLPAAVRSRLVELARAARIELDADAELTPAGPAERTEHRFATDEDGAGRVAAVLAGLPARQLHDCRVLLTHRRTAAGSAPGPLPHPVLIVQVEPGTRRPDMLSYQLAVALERSGLPASVEVLTVGRTVPAYHAEALRSARPLRLDRAGTSSNERAAETTVAVPALPGRRPATPPERPAEPQQRPSAPPERAAEPAQRQAAPPEQPAEPEQRRPAPAEEPAEPLRLDVTPRVRQPGAGRPISAAPPFGESHSDTPLFDDRSADPGAPADHRDADVRRASARLTAVPSVLDETARDRALDERSADGSAEDFHPDEFGRERRGGPAHRAGSPRDDATPVTPIGRTPVPGPTPIPLLRRGGGGRRSLAPVDSDGSPAGGSHRDSDFDPLHDPLSRPLMAPLLDPTPPLTGPIGLVEEPSPVAEESWSGDWLSGAWAERTADGAASDGDRTVEPERPAPRPTVRRAPRHRYLRTPDDPTPDEPGGSQSGPIPLPVRDAERVHRTAGDSGPTSLPTREPAARTGSGAIPMGSGSGTFDGPSGRSSAIPMGPGPSGTLDGPSGRSGAIPMGPGPSDEPSGRSGATPVGPSTSDGPSGRSGAIPMPAGGSAGSGAIPMAGGRSERSGPTPQVPPASRAIPMPGGPSPAATGRTPQSPTRPAIPMPGGGHEPDSRPGGRSDDRPGVDPALGLRPESLARLGEADLNLLARLQAELRGERRSGPDDVETTDGAPADGARPAGPERSPSNASGPNASGPNGTGPNGTGSNRSGHHGTAHHGTAHNGTAHHGPVANGPPYYGPGPDGPGEPGYNGSRHNGSGAHEAGPNGTGAYPAAGPRGPNGGPHGAGAYPAPIFGQNGGGAESTGRNPARPPAPPNGTAAHPAVPFGPGPGGPPGSWPPGGPGTPFPGNGYDSPSNSPGYHQASYQEDNPDRRAPEPPNPAPAPAEESARNGERDKRGRNGSARHGTGSFRAFGGRRRGRNGGGPDGGPPDMAG